MKAGMSKPQVQKKNFFKFLELRDKAKRISISDNGFRHKYINVKKKTIAPMENSIEITFKIKRRTTI